MGIELRASPVANRRRPIAKATRLAVATVLRDGVEGVCHCDDSRSVRDAGPREPARIAVPSHRS